MGTTFLIWQVPDVGTLSCNGASFDVTDVQKFGAYVVHIGTVTGGTFAIGDTVDASVNYARRALVAKNHTTTHMLNHALRAALGVACDQRGSLCDADKLRFDFAYTKPLTDAQLRETQDVVNKQIAAALPVRTQVAAPPSPPHTPTHPPSPPPPCHAHRTACRAECVQTAPAQVSALALATEVNGLRAVFGEQYPDPVRIYARRNHTYLRVETTPT